MLQQQTELQELEELYCDMHKEVYGFKARWYKAATVEEAQADLDRLQIAANEMAEERRIAQASAAEHFEKRVQGLIDSGARNRETALRWVHQAEDTGGDDEYLAYRMGLPYGYFKKVA